MSEIRAVLLIPEEGDPHGLLRYGPCGARPPVAYEGWGGAPLQSWWTTASATANASARFYPSRPHRCALVLAWDGEPVAAGLDRLCRRMEWDVYPRGWASIPAVLSWLDGDAPGTLALIDADGREV